MEYTTNYDLRKPGVNDVYNGADNNENMDAIDAALADKAPNRIVNSTTPGLMTSTDFLKLAGIATGAEKNVQSDWTETSTTSDAYIKNKPSTFPPSAHSHNRLENGVNGLYVTNSGNIIPIKNGGVEASFNPQLGNNTSRFGQIYSTNATISTSDAREKKDIADIEHAQELIMALQPRQFKYVDNQSNRTHYGFIAQEVKEAMTAAGIDDCAAYIRGPLDETANPNTAPEEEVRYGLRYEELIAPLIATVQAQQKEIEFLKTKINE